MSDTQRVSSLLCAGGALLPGVAVFLAIFKAEAHGPALRELDALPPMTELFLRAPRHAMLLYGVAAGWAGLLLLVRLAGKGPLASRLGAVGLVTSLFTFGALYLAILRPVHSLAEALGR